MSTDLTRLTALPKLSNSADPYSPKEGSGGRVQSQSNRAPSPPLLLFIVLALTCPSFF